MAVDGCYFDTSYIVRLYLEDGGYEHVRALASSHSIIHSACHAQTETIAACHRAFRENRITRLGYFALLEQFQADVAIGMYGFLPFSDTIFRRVEQVFSHASASTFLRAADALHLACATEHGFSKIYSNDRHMLAAASLFGLKGMDVISSV